MIKWLLWLTIALVFWGILRSRAQASTRSREGGPAAASTSAAGTAMVACAHCRLYLPDAEALSREGSAFCCEDHYRQWKRRA